MASFTSGSTVAPTPAFTTSATAAPERPVRTNKYAAPCSECGVRVEPGMGTLDKIDGKWVTAHVQPCPPVQQVLPVEPTEAPAPVVLAKTFDGTYSIEKDGGEHRTFRLRTQAADDDFMPGKQIIGYLTGPDNSFGSTDWLNFGTVVNGALRVWGKHTGKADLLADARTLLADPDAAVKSSHCFRCHRVLTVPTSVHNGLGPECAKHQNF